MNVDCNKCSPMCYQIQFCGTLNLKQTIIRSLLQNFCKHELEAPAAEFCNRITHKVVGGGGSCVSSPS